MPKILLGAAVMGAAIFAAPSAYAMGGGPTPYWASSWYSPNEPSTAIERGSLSAEERVQPREAVRRAHRRHRAAPALEQ